jgi:hypothetical protein
VDSLTPEFDLLSFPQSPGHRGVETSVQAAERIAPSAARLQEAVLTAVTNAGPAGITVVEMATRYSLDRMSVQPRFSELRALRKIADSGLRRKNPSGVNAICWTLPEHVREPDQ